MDPKWLAACVEINTMTIAGFPPSFQPTYVEGSASGWILATNTYERYVVTAAHVVLYDEGESRRVPLATALMVQRNAVYVTYNGHIYQATLVLADGAGDIALLRIHPDTPWNVNLPRLQPHHPSLSLSLRAPEAGAPVWTVGNPLGQGGPSACLGVVRSSTFAEASGSIVAESLLISTAVIGGNSGSPIIDARGKVVGLAAWAFRDTMGGGPTARFMAPVIAAALNGVTRAGPHVETIADPNLTINPSFMRYVKGFMGVSWVSVNAFTYATPPGSVAPFLATPAVARYAGLEVRAVVATDSTLDFTASLSIGDIITSIDGRALGSAEGQILPTLVTWSLLPGASITLGVRSPTDGFKSLRSVNGVLGSFPMLADRFGFGIASVGGHIVTIDVPERDTVVRDDGTRVYSVADARDRIA